MGKGSLLKEANKSQPYSQFRASFEQGQAGTPPPMVEYHNTKDRKMSFQYCLPVSTGNRAGGQKSLLV